ncbi:MAG: nucleoside monophosphate kinase [Candidatus Sungbacteria bacterium]|nr:nucleoside monophosphate kinase [Candidatus Sungbacteria bacterium]
MKSFSFPVFKTKVDGVPQKFMLEDPVERRKYFDLKAGVDIEKLREYLQKGNTFVGFLLGPKNSGKGTYTKLFMEAVGGEHIAHISVGDIVRSAHKDLGDAKSRKNMTEFLRRRYRGFISIEKSLDVLEGRDTKTLLPTEIILALVEREIGKLGRKAIFIDGFPRNLDQVSYSLYFRALMGYRDDPDFFVFIDVPEAVIDERMKYRVVCPQCQTPRNTKLLRTKDVEYDVKTKRFYLLCDNPACSGFGKSRMSAKEGDDLGIGAIRERIEVDQKVMATLLELQGAPKIYLRNSVPVDMAKEYIDDYEITPAYRYELEDDKVKIVEEPWTVKDEEGKVSYSLLPAAVALSLIKQTAQVLGL